MNAPKRITLFSHSRIDDTGPAVQRLVEAATAAGIEVLVPHDEAEKHKIPEREGCHVGVDPSEDTDVAVVFGGDGTILNALRSCAGSNAPVFAFNYGDGGAPASAEGVDV